MTSSSQTPLIGEKPQCAKHPRHTIEFVCTSALCKYRVLCKQCNHDHFKLYPFHNNQIVDINKWYREYKKMSSYFDPRDNYQAIYHLQEIGSILKKERSQIEEAGKAMDEAFENVLSFLFEKIRSIKVHMNEYLWKDYINIYDKYNNLVKRFTSFQKKNVLTEIFDEMKEELKNYFAKKNLKEYFDKVYTGQYDEDIYNKYLNINDFVEDIKTIKHQLDKGLNRFDPDVFSKKWTIDLEQFSTSIKESCKTFFIANSKSYQQPVDTKHTFTKVPVISPTNSTNISCLVNLEGFSSSFISCLNSETYLTVSDNGVIHSLNPIQNFRITKEITASEETVSSVAILEYEKKQGSSLVYFVLLGGNDDFPSLELWDCIHDKCLCSLEDIHTYAVNNLVVLKREKEESSQVFYVASGSADGYIKLWMITITQLNENLDFQADFYLRTKILAHDNFISGILTIPKSERFPSSFIISSSHDRSICVWEWENYVEQHQPQCYQEDGETSDSKKENDSSDRCIEKYSDCHTSKINCIALLNDQTDCSDLEFFATGGSEGNIIIWDIFSRDKIKSISNLKLPVSSMEYLKKGRIACASNNRTLKLFNVFVWNWKTGTMILSIADHNAAVQRIVSLERDVFATCDKNTVIRIWQME